MGKLRRGFDDVESVILFLGSSSSVQPPEVEKQQENYHMEEMTHDSHVKESMAIERIGKRLGKGNTL